MPLSSGSAADHLVSVTFSLCLLWPLSLVVASSLNLDQKSILSGSVSASLSCCCCFVTSILWSIKRAELSFRFANLHILSNSLKRKFKSQLNNIWSSQTNIKNYHFILSEQQLNSHDNSSSLESKKLHQRARSFAVRKRRLHRECSSRFAYNAAAASHANERDWLSSCISSCNQTQFGDVFRPRNASAKNKLAYT